MEPQSLSAAGADLPRQRLMVLRESLLALHKTLIDSERATYERTFSTVVSPNQFLNLLLQDPWFAWLRPLSGLVVQIEEALDGEEPMTAQKAQQLVDQARALLKASEEGDGFARSYFEALQREPDVVLAHGNVTKCWNTR